MLARPGRSALVDVEHHVLTVLVVEHGEAAAKRASLPQQSGEPVICRVGRIGDRGARREVQIRALVPAWFAVGRAAQRIRQRRIGKLVIGNTGIHRGHPIREISLQRFGGNNFRSVDFPRRCGVAVTQAGGDGQIRPDTPAIHDVLFVVVDRIFAVGGRAERNDRSRFRVLVSGSVFVDQPKQNTQPVLNGSGLRRVRSVAL